MPNSHHCPGLLVPQSWTLPAHPAASSGPDRTPAPLGAASHPGRAEAATRCCGNRSPSGSSGPVYIGKRNRIRDTFLDLHHMNRLPNQPIFSLIPSSQQHRLSKLLHSRPAELANPEMPPRFALGTASISLARAWECWSAVKLREHAHGDQTFPSHLLLSKVLLVELQRVKLDGELAWVLHHHCPLRPTAVWQQRAQLEHWGAELQLWLQPMPRDLQLEVLAALANVNLQLASVGLLKRERSAESSSMKSQVRGPQIQPLPRGQGCYQYL